MMKTRFVIGLIYFYHLSILLKGSSLTEKKNRNPSCIAYPLPRYGFCKDFIGSNLILRNNRTNHQISKIDKTLRKKELNLERIKLVLALGKFNMNLLRTLLENYISINTGKKFSFPSKRFFEKVVDSLTKSSFDQCVTGIKKITCRVKYPLCKAKKTFDCERHCKRLLSHDCKEQQTAFALLHKLQTNKRQPTFSCKQLCLNYQNK